MILGIDTSLGTAVAVVEPDGVVRAEGASSDPLTHAEVIGILLEAALADAEAGPVGAPTARVPVAITHVAAGMGPGPFTGLRVGIAAARAFALGRGIPVVGVPSHDAAALGVLLSASHDASHGASHGDPFDDVPRFAVVTDARRREYAYTVYDGIDDDGLPVRLTPSALCPRDDIDTVLAGHGARRFDVTTVSASMLALAAARAVVAGRSLADGEPLYLRAPDVTVPAGAKKVGQQAAGA